MSFRWLWPMKFAPQPCHVCRTPTPVEEMVACDHGDPRGAMDLRHPACDCPEGITSSE